MDRLGVVECAVEKRVWCPTSQASVGLAEPQAPAWVVEVDS